MSFVVIDYFAAKEIVSTKNLQSADYDKGKLLAECIKESKEHDFSNNIKAHVTNGGLYLLTIKKNKSVLLVFDTTAFKGFERPNNEIITIIQKSCRLAIKIWDGIGHSPCEKIISNSSFIALLPFSFSTGKSYKVILDKSPDKERQEKRNESSLLIFQDGFEVISKEPKLSIFRKARDNYASIDTALIFNKDKDSEIESNNYINVNNIDGEKTFSIDPYMGMDYWKKNLTETQSRFVFSSSFGPDILTGAAGTGKTLSLILRCIIQLINAEENDLPYKSVLLTHSKATKYNIETILASNGGERFINSDKNQSVVVTTLQEWCIENLGNRIEATEYLDSDAFESKQTQLLYINEAVEDFMINDYAGALSFISEELKDFFSKNDWWHISIILQDEISVYIKGRAAENFDIYKTLVRSEYSIPLKNEDDYKTIFSIFNKYYDKLIALNQFDSDDIILSALQETSTPIWKRRRIASGFDVIYIDETHLFNINELSLFHNLLKPNSNNIIFTMDRSQAIGDTTITKHDVSLKINAKITEEHGLNAVFRSSEHIVNLASCVLASGALLFNNLENPLFGAMSGHTAVIDEKSPIPYIVSKQNKNEMIKSTFLLVDNIANKQGLKRSDVLIIPCSDDMLEATKTYASESNISLKSIEQRGDIIVLESAASSNSYIIGGMEYIGGLEFPAIIILGIDDDKFPRKSANTGESSHYLNYSAFNLLYVAITRAKYEVAFIHEKTQRISELLDSALSEGLVIYDEDLSKDI
ncbi:UvrD-helicase domain-containing protein [Limnobaculum parvum]|uniref:DNA helicase UvrD n=1 Tax=Limnobaculum parvum TaxID=2172103 RepID=A0A2Y9TUL9_9GAMM|nr:UvrD-helicase domain-containing protein [Limnobaculum parvum]AWH87332.1 DNA helicase UvrD [Limnobaculum parvum]